MVERAPSRNSFVNKTVCMIFFFFFNRSNKDFRNIIMASLDGSSALDRASDGFNINICGPCKSDNVERRGNHYCEDCSEYLCNLCKDHHRKFPLLKGHRVVSWNQVPVKQSIRGRPSIVVYCNCNKQQEAQYYCDDHLDILCDPCKVTKHYKCKVSTINNKSSNYTRAALNSVMSKIKTLKDEYDELKKERINECKDLEQSNEHCIKEIKTFREEINRFLHGIEKTMLNELESYKNEEQTRINQHITLLTATVKLLEADYKLLEDAKSDGGKSLMFAAEFQVSKGLQDYVDRLSEIDNDTIHTCINFEKNTKLSHLQNEIDSFGTLSRGIAKKVQRNLKVLLDCQIQSQKQINLKLPEDRSTPWISGSAVMPGGEIVLYDHGNSKLKLLDTSDALKDSMTLKTSPWDISVVDAKTVILTIPFAKQLQYIDVFPKMKPGRVLQLDKQCWGVHVTRYKIFTTCCNSLGEGEVRILDLNGNLQRQLGIRQDGSYIFDWPAYITVSPSDEKIIVSDRMIDQNTITCMTMDNHVIYQYTDTEMKDPTGLYCDDGNNVMVCDEGSSNVQVITADGKKHCELLSSRDGLKWPYSISYREKDNTLIVGCNGFDHVLLFMHQSLVSTAPSGPGISGAFNFSIFKAPLKALHSGPKLW